MGAVRPNPKFAATVGLGSVVSGVGFFLGLLHYYLGWSGMLWGGLFCSWALFAVCARVTNEAAEERREGKGSVQH